jgi:SAM-dependent methyltransferase
MSKKQDVVDFWEAASCGETLYLSDTDVIGYRKQLRMRYELEPFIPPFIDAPRWDGKRVLEVGVGLGADHQTIAEGGAELSGVDLTERAIEHTRRRLGLFGLKSELKVGDAENLPFPDNTFDMVYSWGVIHHSPDTSAAAKQILRVLKPGGTFKVMIYYKWSLTGLMLWLRYGLVLGRPGRTLSSVYAEHLESPGTKAYTLSEATALFADASDVNARTVLTHGDLLSSGAGQRHKGLVLAVARKIWPRWLFRRVAVKNGLFLLVEGRKAA